MEHVGFSDWLVIGAYLAGIMAFGLWRGRGQTSTRDYFLGSRTMPWWGVGFSIVATETSALTFIGVPAMAYGSDNLTFVQIVLGYVIARIILAVVLVPHYFKGEVYSPYQLLAQAFGPAARRTAAGLFLVAGTLAAGVRVYVTCIPLQLMLGFGPEQIVPVIVLFVGLALTYTFFGGVKSAVWVEAVQFLIFLAGGLFALFYIPSLTAGGLGGAFQQAAAGGKLHWFNPAFSLARPFNLWMGLIGATFMVMSSHGADQLIVQRVLTCRSVRDGRKALVLSAVLILPLFLIFLLTGVMLWVYYQQFPNMPIPLPEARPGVSKNDYIFPIFILTAMPSGLKGALLVAILAAAMSSVSAALSALSSVVTMDFYKSMARVQRTAAFELRLSRGVTLGWGALLMTVAFLTSQVESVLHAAFALSGLTSGAMLGGLILAVWWRRGNAGPVVVGMISGLVVMSAVHALPRLDWTKAWWDRVVGVTVFWPWYTLIGTVVTLTVAELVRCLQGRLRAAPSAA
jgi:SSS family transporter